MVLTYCCVGPKYCGAIKLTDYNKCLCSTLRVVRKGKQRFFLFCPCQSRATLDRVSFSLLSFCYWLSLSARKVSLRTIKNRFAKTKQSTALRKKSANASVKAVVTRCKSVIVEATAFAAAVKKCPRQGHCAISWQVVLTTSIVKKLLEQCKTT